LRSTARPSSETDAAFKLMRPNEPEEEVFGKYVFFLGDNGNARNLKIAKALGLTIPPTLLAPRRQGGLNKAQTFAQQLAAPAHV
jgi:hypothetical protein